MKIEPRKYKAYTRRDLGKLPQMESLSAHMRASMSAVSAVFPFRVNNYVVEELIDWNNVPDDPIFQLTFPQAGMLEAKDREHMLDLVATDAPAKRVEAEAREIQMRLNPHPAGQMVYNIPHLEGEPLPGMQHKYRETVLFFPSNGQTCHAYCTYCFRWAQFVGIDELKFAAKEGEKLAAYLVEHPEVQSVLFTGGDPLIMKTATLRRYIEPLLDPALAHINSIRIGTKATAYWPYRFLTDPDADDLLRLFDEVRGAGRQLALMAHYSHPRELETPVAQAAVRRILDTGAVIRCQAPLMRYINDDVDAWADLWRLQVRLGAVPYYMFVARDTGPRDYFSVPLARAHRIFRDAYQRVSGLARTVRGPSMSATPGKVVVEGEARVRGERVFVLKFLQGRNPEWVGNPFFARYDENAVWLDQLKPAFGAREFFFARELQAMGEAGRREMWRNQRSRRPVNVYTQVEWE